MKNILDESPIWKGFKAVLVEKYGKEEGLRLWGNAAEKCNELIVAHPDGPKDSRTVAYPMAGIYMVLKEKDGQEEALRCMYAYASLAGERWRKMLLRITSIPGVSALIWKNIYKIMATMGGEKKGYKSEILDVVDGHAGMNVMVCPIHAALAKAGMPEVAPVMCAMDKIYMTGLRNIAYERTMSVAEGDAYCDYRLIRRKNP